MPASRGNAAADIDEVAENFLSIGQILVRLKANDAAAFDATVRHYGLKPRKAQFDFVLAAAFKRRCLGSLAWSKTRNDELREILSHQATLAAQEEEQKFSHPRILKRNKSELKL